MDFMSPGKVLCDLSFCDNTHMLCWGSVYSVGALLSHICVMVCAACSCTTKGHPGSLSFRQEPYIHRDCDKYCAMDALLSLLG